MRDRDGFETRTRGALVAAALAASVLALVLAPTALGASGPFDRAWGKDVVSSGPGDNGDLFEICVGAAGAICKTGETTTQLGGELNSPEGVAIDSAGNIFVADSNNHRIQKFDPSGNFLLAWGKDVVSSGEHQAGTGFEVCF